MTWLSILGIGEDGVDGLSGGARRRIEAAEAVFGGARHIALAAPLIRGEAIAWPSPMRDGYAAVLARRSRAVVVLASGDPFCFGVGVSLARMVEPGEMECLPAPSAVSLACARLGWALADCTVISFCGRPLAPVLPLLQPGARILALSADAATPVALAALLAAHGFGGTRMHVLSALGGPREQVTTVTAEQGVGEVGTLNLVALEVVAGAGARVLPLAAGLKDGLFDHDGQLTRREVRALTLAALAPRQGEHLVDVGLGAGSVAIEWLLRHPAMRATGIEPDPTRAARARRNAESLGVPSLAVRLGRAPAALEGLAADAVFLGGGVSAPGVIEAAWQALRPGGRIVANAITLASEAALIAAQAQYGGGLTRIGLERLDLVGRMAAFRPAMTVTQFCAAKP